jgi:hypothetical protein
MPGGRRKCASPQSPLRFDQPKLMRVLFTRFI